MAFDCYNLLNITGPREEIARFKNESLGFPYWYKKNDENANDLEPQFCFNALIPMPQEVYDNYDEPVEYEGRTLHKGRVWTLENWGIYHDIYNAHKTVDFTKEDSIEISFDSFEAPRRWFYKVARLFPKLEFNLWCYYWRDNSQTNTWRKGEKYSYYSTNVDDNDDDINDVDDSPIFDDDDSPIFDDDELDEGLPF